MRIHEYQKYTLNFMIVSLLIIFVSELILFY